MIPETEIHRSRKWSVRVSLRGMLRLIGVDTYRRVHNVDFSHGTAHLRICSDRRLIYGSLKNPLKGVYGLKIHEDSLIESFLNLPMFRCQCFESPDLSPSILHRDKSVTYFRF